MVKTKAKTTAETNERTGEVLAEMAMPAAMKIELMTFKISGISPLLQNNPAPFITSDEETGLSAGKKKYDDEEEARLRLYRDQDGDFAHPCEAFIKAMLRAVTGKKFGKLTATTLFKGAVFLAEPMAKLVDVRGKPLSKYSIDRRPVVVGKARILRCRPSWFPWNVNLVLEVDAAILSEFQVREALALAGRIVGIGDYRPEKSGGYGRFQVE